MKPKRHDSQNAPRNGNAAGPAPRPEGDDLNTMWSAVAALLDNQTVSAKAVKADAPAAASSQPAAQAPAASPQAAEEIVWEMPSDPAPAVAQSPVQPSLQAVQPVQPTQPVQSPTQSGWQPLAHAADSVPPAAPQRPASGQDDPFANAPYGAEIYGTDAAGVEPAGAPPSPPPGPTTTRDGRSDLPASPGVGPQLLPVSDPALPATQPAAPTQNWTPPPAFVPREPGSPFTMPVGLDFNSVNIRGRNDGIAIEIGHGVWDDLMNLLSYRLEQSAGFFREGHIAVDVGNRPVTEPELGAMRQVMRSYNMDPSVLRTSAERTFHAAVAVGISVTQVALDGSTVAEAHRAVAEQSAQGYFIYHGSLRSGQVLYRPEHIVVVGDVNPGAEVVSNGDIMVWGRLRGIAHAGARGNTASIITALDLDPVQLRIDTVIAAAQGGVAERGPRWGTARTQARRPEIARLTDGRLLIEAWDEVKSAGTPLLKRRRAN